MSKTYTPSQVDDLLEQAEMLGVKLYDSMSVHEIEAVVRHRLLELISEPETA